MQEPREEQKPANSNTKGIIFGVILILYQLMVCLLYGFLFGYKANLFTEGIDAGGILLTSIMAILMLAGFGLINAYVTKSGVTGMGYTLLIFVLTLQHFFLMRAFWNKAGVNNPSSVQSFDHPNYERIGLSNYRVNLQSSYLLPTASFPDGIGCALSMLVAASPVIGRVGLLQIFFLTLFGTFLYEVNSELLHRFYITDVGYGMRVLLFGSFLGIISTCILGKKETTLGHRRYKSQYQSRALSLFGFVLVFCAYPMLCVSGLLTYRRLDGFILYAAPLNMWLALFSGLLGSFCAAAFYYRRFSIHDLIFSGLAGGFVFSSSSDVNFNPAVPLSAGFLMGFVSSIYSSGLLKRSNNEGVLFTYAHYQRFVTPAIGGAILVAILHGVAEYKNGSYDDYRPADRDATGHGAFQLVGIPLSIAFGAAAGAIVGLLYRIVNNYEHEDHFKDETVYKPLDDGQIDSQA